MNILDFFAIKIPREKKRAFKRVSENAHKIRW